MKTSPVRVCLVAAAAAVAFAAAAFAGAPGPARELKSNEPIERTLAPGRTDAYLIRLRVGETLKLVVEQQGVDVEISLRSPQGELLRKFDSPNGEQGPETVQWLAREPGDYRLLVAALPESGAGKYVIRLEEIRKASRAQLADAQAEQEVKVAALAWEAAVKDSDEATIRRIATSDYRRYYRPEGPVVALDEVLNETRLRPLPLRRRELENLTIRVSGNASLVTFRLISTWLRNAREEKTRLHIVQFWQRRGGQWQLAEERGYDSKPLPRTPGIVKIGEAIQRAYAGTYEDRDGNKITVESIGDHLLYRLPGVPEFAGVDLFPESETEFFSKAWQLGLTFVHDSKGRLTHILQLRDGEATRLAPTK